MYSFMVIDRDVIISSQFPLTDEKMLGVSQIYVKESFETTEKFCLNNCGKKACELTRRLFESKEVAVSAVCFQGRFKLVVHASSGVSIEELVEKVVVIIEEVYRSEIAKENGS